MVAREVGLRSQSQKCQRSIPERSSSLHCVKLHDGEVGAEDTAGVSRDPKTFLQVPRRASWESAELQRRDRKGSLGDPGTSSQVRGTAGLGREKNRVRSVSSRS